MESGEIICDKGYVSPRPQIEKDVLFGCEGTKHSTRTVRLVGGQQSTQLEGNRHWNGFDLTTKAGTHKFKEDLFEKRPRFVWMTPVCPRSGHNNLNQDQGFIGYKRTFWWCFCGLWSRTGGRRFWKRGGFQGVFGLGGAFSEWKEFHSGGTWMSVK